MSGISERPVIPAHLVLLCFPSLAPTPVSILPQAQGGLVSVRTGQSGGGPGVWALGLLLGLIFSICEKGGCVLAMRGLAVL